MKINQKQLLAKQKLEDRERKQKEKIRKKKVEKSGCQRMRYNESDQLIRGTIDMLIGGNEDILDSELVTKTTVKKIDLVLDDQDAGSKDGDKTKKPNKPGSSTDSAH